MSQQQTIRQQVEQLAAQLDANNHAKALILRSLKRNIEVPDDIAETLAQLDITAQSLQQSVDNMMRPMIEPIVAQFNTGAIDTLQLARALQWDNLPWPLTLL